MKQIKITVDERRLLEERFHCGANYINDVLSYRKDGKTAQKIRRTAIQLGGRYVDPDFVPNCRTEYNSGLIIQTFGDRVVLTIDRGSGDIELCHKGEVVDQARNANMSTWSFFAQMASDMALSAMAAR